MSSPSQTSSAASPSLVSLLPAHAPAWLGTAIVLSFALLLRACVGLSPHSGEHQPPMFGDYEAQRHWMEITLNTPLAEWYEHTSNNDLQYWGLDYPPLTAFHSWVMGVVATKVHPPLVELYSSRGHESETGRVFMRMTALVADALVFFPALIFCARVALPRLLRTGEDTNSVSDQAARLGFLLLSLCQPCFIIIDHGHFQYNAVSLGLSLAAMACVLARREVAACCLFCLAMGYKQISLYFAPAFFVYLLSDALVHARHGPGLGKRIKRVATYAVAVIATLGALLYPFYREGGVAGLLQVAHRVFPFARGLFEDKVASFWCVSSLIIKWRRVFSLASLVRLSTVTTLVAVAPGAYLVARRPTRLSFLYYAALSSLCFFLLAFHAHEKSLLFPALPIAMLLPRHPLFATHFAVVATFSLTPLLAKDKLLLPAAALSVFYVYAAYACRHLFEASSVPRVAGNKQKPLFSDYAARVCAVSMASIALLCVAIPLLPDSKRYPDLKTVAVAAVSFAHLAATVVILHVFMWRHAHGGGGFPAHGKQE